MFSFLVLVLIACHFSTSAFPNPFKKIKEKLNDVKNEIKNEFMAALKNNGNNEIFADDINISTMYDESHLRDSPEEKVVGIIQHDDAVQYSMDDYATIDDDIIEPTKNIMQNSLRSDIEKADTIDRMDNDRTNNEFLTHIPNDDIIPVIIDANTIDLDSIISHFTSNESIENSGITRGLEIARKTIEEDLLKHDAIARFRQEAEEELLNLEEVDVLVHETLKQESEVELRLELRQKDEVEEDEEEELYEGVDEVDDEDDEVVGGDDGEVDVAIDAVVDVERLRQEAEDERLRQEAEDERLRQEAERLRREAERLRLEAEEQERIRHEAYYGNWSSFSVLSYVDPEFSHNIIKSLKFSSYFDKSIGEFKVGILGDDVTSVLPDDLIINVEKAMNRKFINVSSVDITSLLSHSLASIQHVATMLIPLHIHPQLDALSEKPERLSQVESIFAAAFNNKNSFLSKEIRISRNIIENKLYKIESRITKQQELAMHNIAHEAYKLQRNFELLKNQNDYLLELIAKSSGNTSDAIAADHKERLELLVIGNSNVLNESTQVFKIQLKMEEAMLKHKVDVSIELLKYKAMQEQQYVIENELNNNILLEIMNNNTRDSTQKVIETIFNDVTHMVHKSIMEDPIRVIFNNMHVIAIVFGVVLVVEIVRFIPTYLTHRKNSNILLKSNQMRKGKNRFQLSELVLSGSVTSDLKTYMDNVEVGLRYKCPMIPNMLIIGSSGTGKSVLAYAIAEQLQAAYISICEADLEPLGMNAGFYLRNLFQSKYGAASWHRRNKPFLVIIDGADLLVKPRAPKLMSKSTTNVSPRGTPHAVDTANESITNNNADDRVISNCLYTLLNEMKSASPDLSLIITTNRSVSNIDSAILNRTDSMIVLTTPSQLQRLRFILYYLPIQVGQFLDDETRKILSDESLVQLLRSMNTGNTSASKITNPLFRAIISGIKKLGSNDPETDRPASLNLKIVTVPVVTPEAFNIHSNTKFDLENCISHFVVMTEGWSFRELDKFLLSVRQEILSVSYVGQNSKLVLTSMIFMKTLSLVGNNSSR